MCKETIKCENCEKEYKMVQKPQEKYYIKNREEILRKQREYYLKNKEAKKNYYIKKKSIEKNYQIDRFINFN